MSAVKPGTCAKCGSAPKRKVGTAYCVECEAEYQREYRKAQKAKYPWKELLRGAKYRAKRDGLEYNLTPYDIDIPDVCPVLGIPMIKPTLDRVDSTKGYTPNNTRVISHRANYLKGDATLEELEALVAYVRSQD